MLRYARREKESGREVRERGIENTDIDNKINGARGASQRGRARR